MVFKKTSKRGTLRTNVPNPKPETRLTLIPSPTPTSAIVHSPTTPPFLGVASAPPQSTPTTTLSSSGLNLDEWRQQISYAPFLRPCQSSNELFQKRLPSSWMHPAPTPHASTSLKNCATPTQAAQNHNYVQQSLPQTWNTQSFANGVVILHPATTVLHSTQLPKSTADIATMWVVGL